MIAPIKFITIKLSITDPPEEVIPIGLMKRLEASRRCKRRGHVLLIEMAVPIRELFRRLQSAGKPGTWEFLVYPQFPYGENTFSTNPYDRPWGSWDVRVSTDNRDNLVFRPRHYPSPPVLDVIPWTVPPALVGDFVTKQFKMSADGVVVILDLTLRRG